MSHIITTLLRHTAHTTLHHHHTHHHTITTTSTTTTTTTTTPLSLQPHHTTTTTTPLPLQPHPHHNHTTSTEARGRIERGEHTSVYANSSLTPVTLNHNPQVANPWQEKYQNFSKMYSFECHFALKFVF